MVSHGGKGGGGGNMYGELEMCAVLRIAVPEWLDPDGILKKKKIRNFCAIVTWSGRNFEKTKNFQL